MLYMQLLTINVKIQSIKICIIKKVIKILSLTLNYPSGTTVIEIVVFYISVHRTSHNTINKGYEDIIFIDKYDLEIVFSSK